MLRVGLTGGIASGKSSVSILLARLGAVVIDSDALAREVVVAGTSGLAEIEATFGPDVINDDLELDRVAMGRIVFNDEEARQRLESIIHPRVRAGAVEIERMASDSAVVVHDIPLLVETGQADNFDVVVVVDAPSDLQQERLTRERGMSVDEAAARINAQASREQRLAVADHVLTNTGTLSELSTAVDALWAQLTQIRPTATELGQVKP